jgi:histone deacetylase 6
MSYPVTQQDLDMDANGDITMSEAGPSKRADETDPTSNHDSSKPPVFVLPPDPSEAKAKNAKFSYVTAESRLPPRNPESFPPSRKTGVVYDAQMMLHAPLNYNPDLDWEEMSDADDDKYYLAWHPEDPRRIQKIYDQLQEQGLTKQMLQLPCPTVSVSDVLLVHSEALYNKVEKTQCKRQSSSISHYAVYSRAHNYCYTDENRADILKQTELYEYNSLYVNQHTARSASLSCGGVVCAAKAVVMGKVKNAMAIVRPPGHHAEPECCMGFSFYNNVAVAARVVQKELGVKRILVLDW